MSARRSALFATLIAVVLLGAHCDEGPAVRIRAGDQSVRRVQRAARATRAGGVVVAPGDWVIEGPRLRAVVGGLEREGQARGAILEARIRGTEMAIDDGIVLLATRLWYGGASRSAQIVPHAMYAVLREGRPLLRIEGRARVSARTVEVVREIGIARVGSVLAIHTRIDLPEDARALRRVQVGTRVGWGGALPFLPGHGPLEDEAWHDAAWVARRGEGASTALAARDGPLKVRAVWEQHGTSRFLLHTDALGAERTVEPGGTVTERTALVVTAGGLAVPVRRVGWWRGSPFPEVRVHLPYVPEGATVRLTTVPDGDLRTALGLPLLRTRPDAQGDLILPLTPIAGEPPPREAIVIADAYGHAPSDPLRVTGRRGERVVLVIPEGGRVRVTATEAEGGTPMPVRVRVLGVAPPKPPELGPDWSAAGAGDTVITMEGDTVIPLEPGRWRVVVTRGPEWTLAEETVDVTETFRPHVRVSLEHVVDPGEWVPCDFHVHAAPSPDSQVTLTDRVASLIAEGIRFAVPTDHNHVTDYAPAAAAIGIADFGTIPGVEVTTWEPHFGHFNAYPYPRNPELPNEGAPPWEGTTPEALFAAIHAADPDAVVQINHPRMEGEIGYFERMGLDASTGAAADAFRDDFEVIEVWNGFDLARPEALEAMLADWMALLRRGRRYVGVGNSDSHLVRYQWAGYPRTYVRVPGGSVADARAVVRALRAGRVFVTSGPFLEASIDGRGPGETVAPRGGKVVVRVRVQAPDWIDVTVAEVWVDGQLAVARPIEPPRRPRAAVRFEADLEVPVPDRAFVQVFVRGDRPLDLLLARAAIPPLAFTNPIWIDAGTPIAQDAGPGVVDAGPAAPPPPP